MNKAPVISHMDNLTMAASPADDRVGKPEHMFPTFTEESVSALETLDKCRILLEMEYDRSSRSVKDHLINPITQVRNSLTAIKQITEKS
jgi:hypothetical protein